MFQEQTELEDIMVAFAFSEGRIYSNHKGHSSDTNATS